VVWRLQSDALANVGCGSWLCENVLAAHWRFAFERDASSGGGLVFSGERTACRRRLCPLDHRSPARDAMQAEVRTEDEAAVNVAGLRAGISV
jgi:hypothetical protein